MNDSKPIVEVVPMGQELAANFRDKDWALLIRQIDDQSDGKFLGLIGKEMTPALISKFIPNWKDLDFRPIKQIDGRVWYSAESDAYRLTIAPLNSSQELGQLKAKLEEFMNG